MKEQSLVGTRCERETRMDLLGGCKENRCSGVSDDTGHECKM